MKSRRIINALLFLEAIFVLVSLFTYAHVCGSMGEMEAKCHKTKHIAIVLSIVLILTALVQIAVDKISVNNLISLAQVVLGVVFIILPTVIAPVCKMKTMNCYTTTKPLLIISGIAIVILTVVEFLASLTQVKKA